MNPSKIINQYIVLPTDLHISLNFLCLEVLVIVSCVAEQMKPDPRQWKQYFYIFFQDHSIFSAFFNFAFHTFSSVLRLHWAGDSHGWSLFQSSHHCHLLGRLLHTLRFLLLFLCMDLFGDYQYSHLDVS